MNKEFLKMQKLAGIITENQYQNQVNENELIDKFKKYIDSDDITSIDIDYYSTKNNLTPEQKALLKKTFLKDFSIKSTGPVPDIRYKFDK
jgi:hypothetical protein